MLHSLIVGEAIIITGEKDLTWQMMERKNLICVVILSNHDGDSEPYLANVLRNKTHRTVHLVVSAHMI